MTSSISGISDRIEQPPVTISHPGNVAGSQLRLTRDLKQMLHLTIDSDRAWSRVKVVRAAPLTHPDRYISFLDEKGVEICMIDDPGSFNEETRNIINEELERRYLTSTILSVRSIRNEFGTSYWDVETDRGEREFVVQNAEEHVRRLSSHRLLILDVDGNRFEIPRLEKLDRKSLGMIERTL